MIEPKSFAGNRQQFTCFIWFEKPDDAEQWGIYHLDHRDSGLLNQSNAGAIRKALEPFGEDQVQFQEFSHWAVGWINAVAIRVFKPGSDELTDAFQELQKLVEQLEDYPILDEQDYSEREYEATLENIRFIGEFCRRVRPDAGDDWPHRVYEWLSENDPDALENTDDQGGGWDEERVGQALAALGFVLLSADRVPEGGSRAS
jgi:hypothetical protein